MALPHPQTGKDHDRNEDIPGTRGVLRKFVEWTVDVTEYRDAEDQVNPSENRARQASIRALGCISRLSHDAAPSI
jgi:hypothetical protein